MYRHYLKIIVFLLLSIPTYSAKAANVDLELQIDINISQGVEFLQTGKFSITLVNHGPGDAGSDSSGAFPVAVQTRGIPLGLNGLVEVSFQKDNSINQDCIFGTIVGDPPPGGSVSYSFGFFMPVIPANSSMTCFGEYTVGFEAGSKVIEWIARSANDNELNIDNNNVELIFNIHPRIIPTTNIYFLILLIVLILMFHAKFNKRNI